MTEMIYEYDGSFEGFLTCIFESYAQKEVLTAISCGEDIPFMLFPVRTVLTDRDHAAQGSCPYPYFARTATRVKREHITFFIIS